MGNEGMGCENKKRGRREGERGRKGERGGPDAQEKCLPQKLKDLGSIPEIHAKVKGEN